MPGTYFMAGCSSAVIIVKKLNYYGDQLVGVVSEVATDFATKAQVAGKEAINSATNSAANAIKLAVGSAKKQLALAVSDAKQTAISVAKETGETAVFVASEVGKLVAHVHKQNPRKLYVIASMAALGAAAGMAAVAKYYSAGYFEEAADNYSQSWLMTRIGMSVVDAAWRATKYVSAANVGLAVGGIFGNKAIELVERHESELKMAEEKCRREAAEAEFKRLCTTKKAF